MLFFFKLFLLAMLLEKNINKEKKISFKNEIKIFFEFKYKFLNDFLLRFIDKFGYFFFIIFFNK